MASALARALVLALDALSGKLGGCGATAVVRMLMDVKAERPVGNAISKMIYLGIVSVAETRLLDTHP